MPVRGSLAASSVTSLSRSLKDGTLTSSGISLVPRRTYSAMIFGDSVYDWGQFDAGPVEEG